jgi:hypothetical protein
MCRTLWRPEEKCELPFTLSYKIRTPLYQFSRNPQFFSSITWRSMISNCTHINKYTDGNYGKEFIYALKYTFTDPIFTGLSRSITCWKKTPPNFTKMRQNCVAAETKSLKNWRTSPQKALKSCGIIRAIIPMSACRNRVPYILESNPHTFYSFRGLKNQMRIRIAIESWILEKWYSRCTCRKNNKIIYYFIYYL